MCLRRRYRFWSLWIQQKFKKLNILRTEHFFFQMKTWWIVYELAQNKNYWNLLMHFMPLVSFYTPWKHQNAWFSDIFRGYRKKSWHKMGWLTWYETLNNRIRNIASIQIEFLDVPLHKGSYNKVQTLYKKPTDHQNHLHTNTRHYQRKLSQQASFTHQNNLFHTFRV